MWDDLPSWHKLFLFLVTTCFFPPLLTPLAFLLRYYQLCVAYYCARHAQDSSMRAALGLRPLLCMLALC